MKNNILRKSCVVMIILLVTGSILNILPEIINAQSNNDRIIYYFDVSNGENNDGNSPWGSSLNTLPEQNGYHLPAQEGYISHENQYDVLSDETEYGFGYYINMLWPDGIHWNWDGTYQTNVFRRPPGLWWGNGEVVLRDPNPAKVLVYSPWTGKGCIAVIGDSGPAPWTGRQAGVSNKVFDALGLPGNYIRNDGITFERDNPNPGHSPNSNTNPEDYPVIMYSNNPYWVEFSWADQNAVPGPTPINGSPLNFPTRDDNLIDNLYWNVPFNYFGNWYDIMGGFHSGEDWNLVGGDPNADLNQPVYTIYDGKVVKTSNLGSLGYLIALEHNAPPNHLFKIPGKEGSEHGQTYWYKTEYITKFYSVYIHITPIEGITEGSEVAKGALIGHIMNPGGGPHLHFEIRHPDAKNSASWSLVGDSSNWARDDGIYTGYYLNIQEMVNAGVRDPNEFILANSIFAGQQWLRNNQNADGSWTYSGRITEENIGLTSMATTTFLNNGIGESDPTVSKAIDWILSMQQSDGKITKSVYHAYDTSFAILALVSTRNNEYYNEIQDATNFLIALQNDEGEGYTLSDSCYGGWPYYEGMTNWADLSNGQFVLLALHYAEQFNPGDKIVPDVVWDKAETYLTKCQNREISNPNYNFYDDGGFIYGPSYSTWAGGHSYGSMTTAGLWGLYTIGVAKSDGRVQDAWTWIQNHYFINQNYPIGNTFLYYYLYGLAKACILWEVETVNGNNWYEEMSQMLVNNQHTDGHWLGTDASEEPNNVATCWALLALESKQIPEGVILHFEVASPVDLHVYDPLGRHIGINYDTGIVENEIPGATYSGPGTRPQIIEIPDPIAGTYITKFVGTGDGSFTFTIRGLLNGILISEDGFTGYITEDEFQESHISVSSLAGAITVEILDHDLMPPQISIITPAPDDTIQDGITFSSLVSDPGGVNWVRYSIRNPGGLQGTVINPTFESIPAIPTGNDKWELPFDTTQLPDGYYVLYVNARDNLGNEGNTTVNFSIRNWAVLEMLPNTANKKAGSTMPIKFSLRIAAAVDPSQLFVRNEDLTIKIYEKGHPETILQESYYGDTSTDYRISSSHYITNFKTLKTPKTYVVHIWRNDLLIGSFEFKTVK